MARPRNSEYAPEPPSVPLQHTGPRRKLAPASVGLPPSGVTVDKARRIAKKNPGKAGRPTAKATETLIDTTLAVMDTEKPRDIALSLGLSADATPVKAVIRAARHAFAMRAEEYVDLHLMAAGAAAAKGDGRPAEWALERIAEGGERVVDSPKTAPSSAPSFNLGFVIGGVPQPTKQVTAAELPALVGTVLPSEADMP